MKLTSAKRDYVIYGSMTVIFLAASIFFFMRYGTSEIWYLLLMVLFFLGSVWFLIGALRFRVTWGEDGFGIRQGLMPEKHFALEELEQTGVQEQMIILVFHGKKYGFSQGCPGAMELIEFLEKTYQEKEEGSV